MLLFGYLGEIKVLSILYSTILGFIPFIILLYKIYSKLNNKEIDQDQNNDDHKNDNKNKLLLAFVIMWSLYGLNHLVLNLYITPVNIKNETK